MRYLRHKNNWILAMLGGMVVLGCKGSGGSSPVEEKQAALSTCDRTFSVSFPAGVSRDAVVFASNASLTIRDGVHLLEPTSGFAASSNNGSATLNIGNDTRIGSVTSVGSVVLGDRASVTGDVRTSGTITKGNSVVITGSAVQHATLTPPTTMSWSVCTATSIWSRTPRRRWLRAATAAWPSSPAPSCP